MGFKTRTNYGQTIKKQGKVKTGLYLITLSCGDVTYSHKLLPEGNIFYCTRCRQRDDDITRHRRELARLHEEKCRLLDN